MPANTGKAGAIYSGGFFSGMPAPTDQVHLIKDCG
ncbi:hypothetical protein PSEG_00089 [Pseudomonas sp. Nvir]|jgi:hypothetical protein|nr:hypothetical protein PSNVIR_02755 [Pseudomonas sp. Nvir]